MAGRVVKFGIIGGGLMGREFASVAARWCHLLESPAAPCVTAVCDANPAALDWFQTRVDTVSTVTTDLDEFLASDIEAVYCAVPHHLHAQMYRAILSAGKHLLAEKPFGIDLAACESILDSVGQNPHLLVRCSSEFPFFPAAQRIFRMIEEGAFGDIIEVRAGFLHSSDLDPMKPINWKRRVATCGEYGCMGDLGMHVLHVPLRAGWRPTDVRALLTKIIRERPDGAGGMAPCETWDNAVLACDTKAGFPMILETKRISPGDSNTWYLRVYGTRNSAEFSTKYPKTLRTMPYRPGEPQTWREEDLGHQTVFPTITGPIFEFGFPDAMLQMWASFIHELVEGTSRFGCVTPAEAHQSHLLFTSALMSQKSGQTVAVPHA